MAMSKTVHAVFENGVFRPVESVDLPEKAEVEFEPRLVEKNEALVSRASNQLFSHHI